MIEKRFFSTLNYSSCNEDWRTERRALRIGPGDRVLSVTGSGDRPLHCLLDGPAEVVALDASAAQNHLLRLKMAALSALPYGAYVSFLGLRPAAQRWGTLAALESHLPSPTLEFWRSRRAAIQAGVLYEGRWERYYQVISRIAHLLRGREIRRLFEFRDLTAQRAFVREVWDRPWWRAVFDLLCSRAVSRVFLRDPAFYAHVDPAMRPGRYVYEGMRRVLERYLARENFMLSLIFRGRLAEEDLPPYLAPEPSDAIRAGLGRIEIVTADVTAHLEGALPGRFTRFSLSDLPSYLDQPGFERLLAALVRAAAPGARFCIREFLSAHRVPDRLALFLRRETALEEELRQEDRAFAYRFLVGTVEGGAG
jgi:S-adenosylmethionine-diacylglycerol 3-amino-3-carboxypropyl transferase